MSDEQITFEVDGMTLQGNPGDMLIEVTDKAGINIPRFCYHRKLSIAANCRMCLVEVERAPKPLPACSTPISEGMKVSTRSPKAISAQRSTMEFLLINHPLDCPICDQGGECELQDVAMGYGEGVGQYSEAKRVVKDKDIGPLIATDMTRCIHCTRCVRFGEEIAGLKELGATGRSDQMEIGTYISKSVTSELSGNVIDLCPVGALTAKPSRYTHRPWELVQHKHVSTHDAFGSNLYLHTREAQVMRVVPRDNEAVNETWIADRDRFAYTGLVTEDRLTRPMVKRDGEWQVASWEEALEAAAKGIQEIVNQQGPTALAALVSPNASIEEQYLAARIVRGMGSNNIDHRLRQTDFSGDANDPVMPWLGMDIPAIAGLDAALTVGLAVREEVPLFGHRLRQAALDNGARLTLVHPYRQALTFPARQVASDEAGGGQLGTLVALVRAAGGEIPASLADWPETPVDEASAIVEELREGGQSAIFLGAVAQNAQEFAAIRALAGELARLTGAQLGLLAQGGNAAGAWLAGAVPHRSAGGAEAVGHGRTAAELLAEPSDAMMLLGVEPEHDSAAGQAALAALEKAACVVAISSYVTPAMKRYADVLLPMGTAVETAGTWVNGEGRWQSVNGAVRPLGESRPAWKVLRVMGNLLDLNGFDYMAVTEIRRELQSHCQNVALNNRPVDLDQARFELPDRAAGQGGYRRVAAVGMYAGDPVVRRSPALQATEKAETQRHVLVNPSDAEREGWEDGATVSVEQDGAKVELPLRIDDNVTPGTVVVFSGTHSDALAPRSGRVEIHMEVAA
ncbi:MAG: NADH-quinone oxidoreductase subunit NuoG [Guyparkeria sp.]|uniref:NADH-quinone oxidoreductase subunit NuoG n=1 Tax=Guyparkeria sp. TaxID=2035736 RepID=UPI0039792E6D